MEKKGPLTLGWRPLLLKEPNNCMTKNLKRKQTVSLPALRSVSFQPAFNFEMAFHEYDKFATRKAKLFRYDRSVVMKAWEALQDLELITPVDKGAVTKAQKEFRHFTLQVLPEQILSVVDASAPLTVKEWATR